MLKAEYLNPKKWIFENEDELRRENEPKIDSEIMKNINNAVAEPDAGPISSEDITEETVVEDIVPTEPVSGKKKKGIISKVLRVFGKNTTTIIGLF